MSMFGPPRHLKLAEIVSLEDPENARQSVEELYKEFKEGNRKWRLTVLRATQLAANRAKAQLHRARLSEKEKREFSEIAEIYEEASDIMELAYAMLYAPERIKRKIRSYFTEEHIRKAFEILKPREVKKLHRRGVTPESLIKYLG